MRTLHLPNVPDEVVERLELLAAREGVSVSSMAVRELAESTKRADNPALLGDLPDFNVGADQILRRTGRGAGRSLTVFDPSGAGAKRRRPIL